MKRLMAFFLALGAISFVSAAYYPADAGKGNRSHHAGKHHVGKKHGFNRQHFRQRAGRFAGSRHHFGRKAGKFAGFNKHAGKKHGFTKWKREGGKFKYAGLKSKHGSWRAQFGKGKGGSKWASGGHHQGGKQWSKWASGGHGGKHGHHGKKWWGRDKHEHAHGYGKGGKGYGHDRFKKKFGWWKKRKGDHHHGKPGRGDRQYGRNDNRNRNDNSNHVSVNVSSSGKSSSESSSIGLGLGLAVMGLMNRESYAAPAPVYTERAARDEQEYCEVTERAGPNRTRTLRYPIGDERCESVGSTKDMSLKDSGASSDPKYYRQCPDQEVMDEHGECVRAMPPPG
jgi:hypothetical protein